MCKSCSTCFIMFYCMFYFTCNQSFIARVDAIDRGNGSCYLNGPRQDLTTAEQRKCCVMPRRDCGNPPTPILCETIRSATETMETRAVDRVPGSLFGFRLSNCSALFSLECSSVATAMFQSDPLGCRPLRPTQWDSVLEVTSHGVACYFSSQCGETLN